jgi:hypothetical protein
MSCTSGGHVALHSSVRRSGPITITTAKTITIKKLHSCHHVTLLAPCYTPATMLHSSHYVTMLHSCHHSVTMLHSCHYVTMLHSCHHVTLLPPSCHHVTLLTLCYTPVTTVRSCLCDTLSLVGTLHSCRSCLGHCRPSQLFTWSKLCGRNLVADKV